ncbi:RNase adapter RapZ [Jeotgalibaca dankookensis]|uniref:RNase adapter RapZ n=1 Tax=Jeotgalibaca dankookensis TaxID=708126 RepID=UPI000782FE6D|nr:RNase adapter RapZ [Jeotgalibaca dankookensis]
MTDTLELVIITGMSGAGKTVVLQTFEDLEYFCVDNMPPSLLPKFWELVKESGKITKVCLVIDLRSRVFFDEIMSAIGSLDNTSFVTTKTVFLDADDDVLVSRYKETRRSHPLAQSSGRVMSGIKEERELLADIRSRAQWIVNTSKTTPRELREMILEKFQTDDEHLFHIEVVSFGFKYAAPIDADIMMDVRFLPNPHYIENLRPLTGLDKPVYDYVMQQPETETFYRKFIDLLDYVTPSYKREGKTSLTIAIGCTGGQHRSVALSERIASHLKNDGYPVNISHRDKDKRKQATHRS